MKYRKEPYITQRQGKNGMWSFQVFIRSGDITITKSFSEKTYGTAKLAYDTAILYRNRTLIDIADRTILRKNNITVREIFEDYLETSPATIKTKEYHEKLFNKYITHKDKKIQELTRADIAEELNAMVEVASDDTIKRVYSVWKNDIIETAISKDYINKDLTIGLKKPVSRYIVNKRGVDTDRITVLNVEDYILHSVNSHYDAKVIIAFLETMYYTGMRPAEVAVLTRDDIRNGFISVTKELGSSKDKKNVVRACKTPSSIRKVPVHPSLQPILDDLFDRAKTGNLYARENGTYMDSTWLSNIIHNVCRKNNVEFNMYRLRHNMATSLVTNNVDSRTTMEILGHTNYDMSLYYAYSNDELKEDAVKLIS